MNDVFTELLRKTLKLKDSLDNNVNVDKPTYFKWKYHKNGNNCWYFKTLMGKSEISKLSIDFSTIMLEKVCELLEDDIKYRPGGEGFLQSFEHFNKILI